MDLSPGTPLFEAGQLLAGMLSVGMSFVTHLFVDSRFTSPRSFTATNIALQAKYPTLALTASGTS